jgi:hypothetical protein
MNHLFAVTEDVYGRTTDTDGRPIAGAHIYFDVPQVGDRYRTRSGSDGRYEIELPNGAYNVTARYYLPDQPREYVKLVTDDDQLSAAVRVPPGGSINFTVP